MMSHALTSSTNGDFDRCGKYWFETLPQPMTPTRIFFCCEAASPSIDDTRQAAPAIAVR